MTLKIMVLRGLPGSGKSTRAKELLKEHHGSKRINRDSLREMIDAGLWSKPNEAMIKEAELALARLFLSMVHDVIVDDCNLAPSAFALWEDLAAELNVPLQVHDLRHIPLEECIKRDQGRPHYVGEAVIRKMHRDFIAQPPPLHPHIPAAPNAIICDLDGTLCLFGDANPYHRDFSCDLPNMPVREVLRRFYDTHSAILVSGRKEEARAQTVAWLETYGVSYEHLYMRPQGDNRSDVLVKQEIYENHIKGKYNVAFIIDDRTSVVRFWREQGLVVLQCAEGNF